MDGAGGERQGGELYDVEEILEKSADGKQYRVKWVGYPDPTWEPVENFVSELIISPCSTYPLNDRLSFRLTSPSARSSRRA